MLFFKPRFRQSADAEPHLCAARTDLAPYHVFVPAIWLGGVFGVLNLLFYYWLGNALARVWGRFPHDAVSGAGHAGCVGQLLSDSYAGPSAIFQSMLFAYTWLWPDQMVLLFGIIPFKMNTWAGSSWRFGLQLFDGQLRHQGQPRAGAGGFSGVLWPRGL